MSNRIFANTGKAYSVVKILDDDRKLDHAKYAAYSKVSFQIIPNERSVDHLSLSLCLSGSPTWPLPTSCSTDASSQVRCHPFRRCSSPSAKTDPSSFSSSPPSLYRHRHSYHPIPQEGDIQRFQNCLQGDFGLLEEEKTSEERRE